MGRRLFEGQVSRKERVLAISASVYRCLLGPAIADQAAPGHGRIQPVMLGWVKLPRVRGEGRRAKVRGPNGRERGWSCWGGGSQPHPHQLGVLESAVDPSGVRGGAPAAKVFSYILEAPRGLSRNLLGGQVREGGHGPLKVK